VALEVRQETEQALKEGRLRAVVATASLELGIDMGTVDLVCQVESPGQIARGLQRVGRAGHLVGQASKGRLLAKTLPDLLNEAVLAAEMAAGRVEALRVPQNCLDVLAQQIIAMTAMDEWPVDELYRLVRRAAPYHELTPGALDATLEMVTGRYRFTPPAIEGNAQGRLLPAQQLSALQPRISWDRVHQRLQALPGSQRLALVHGGTIPDTGQYGVYTTRGLRLGEVDEEFVYERRIGDIFLLGTNAWRIDRIDTDRVVVVAAEGAPAMVPFWRGESTGRSHDLGVAQGKFLRELGDRLDRPDCLDWLRADYFLDAAAAHNLRDFVRRQRLRTGCLPTDRTLVIEASRDPLGDWQVILLSPLGRNLHLSLRLAIEHRLHERLGYAPQCLHHDDGILVRLTESDEPVLDLFEGISADNVREMILEELADSALFALRFRQNAARALLLPNGGGAGKRAPLWLQRLRGRDLLQVARRHPDFPIVTETFRECLHDHLDLPRLQQLLRDIQTGAIEVKTCRLEAPSPFASGLLFAFTAAFMYQYDGVETESDRGATQLDRDLLDQLIGHDGRPLPIDPRAVQQTERRLRGIGLPPRSQAEAAEWLRKLGDVTESELEGPTAGFLRALEQEGTVKRIVLPRCAEPERWILTEEAEHYAGAFAADGQAAESTQEAARVILHRYLATHALVGLEDILRRYPLERGWAQAQIEEWARTGRLIRIVPTETEPLQWSAPENFEQMQRGTLSILRREVVTCPAAQFADFLTRWQMVHPDHQAREDTELAAVLHRLQALPLPLDLVEPAILPARCRAYEPRQLDALMAAGEWIWIDQGDAERGTENVTFIKRAVVGSMPAPALADNGIGPAAAAIVELLRTRGALFIQEVAEQQRLSLAAARRALWSLVRLGLATNDHFDLLRRGEPPHEDEAPVMRSRGELRAFLHDSRRRQNTAWPEGRWSLVGWGCPDPEQAAFFQARLLLERYGIVSRELALLSGTPTPWRVLYEIMSRMELAGEVRRGYFVEGLSGAQFALPEASRQLQAIGLPSSAGAPVLLLHSLDPANLYGSGGALEMPDIGEQAFARRHGNWLAVKAGRPTLLIEQNGKRLFAPPSAAPEDIAAGVARLPELLQNGLRRDPRHKLTVETWNDQPITATAGKDLLEQVGFVRDYQAMTLWHRPV
jgi:ATP-dependent Lhr-like helicase